MSVIDLTALKFANIIPIPLSFGTVTTPPQGGEEEVIDRPGDRWSFQCRTKPYRWEPDGRRIAAKLDDASKNGALILLSQPGLILPSYGTVTVTSTTATGRSIPITGALPGRLIQAGQWASITHSSQRFVDRIMDDVVTSVSGTATLRIKNLLRKALSAGDSVELSRPVVEGVIRGGVSESWDVNRLCSFQFTIAETR